MLSAFHASRVDIINPLTERTPLYEAAMAGNQEKVEKLLKQKADPNLSSDIDDMSPLHIAISCNHPDVALLLIFYDAHLVPEKYEPKEQSKKLIGEAAFQQLKAQVKEQNEKPIKSAFQQLKARYGQRTVDQFIETFKNHANENIRQLADALKRYLPDTAIKTPSPPKKKCSLM